MKKDKFAIHWRASIPRFYSEDSEEYQSGLDHYYISSGLKINKFNSEKELKNFIADKSVEYGEQSGDFSIIKTLKNGEKHTIKW